MYVCVFVCACVIKNTHMRISFARWYVGLLVEHVATLIMLKKKQTSLHNIYTCTLPSSTRIKSAVISALTFCCFGL